MSESETLESVATQPSHRERQLEGKVEYLTQKLKEQQGVKNKKSASEDQQLLKEMADKLQAQQSYIQALEEATRNGQDNTLLQGER